MEPPPTAAAHSQPDHDSDADTASQRSISLDSPPLSPRTDARDFLANPGAFLRSDDKRESNQFTVDTDFSSDTDDMSMHKHRASVVAESPNTTAPPSIFEEEPLTATKQSINGLVDSQPSSSLPTPMATTYPPTPSAHDDTISISSLTSNTSSRKARPESLLVSPPEGPLVLGIALVDFNHLVGPRIEWSKGDIFNDEEVAKILPFLALPDGAHLSTEDYSYFHLVPPGLNTTTIFGISCNQQIASKLLLVKDPDVTRSIVQKAVVVLASKPVFGPIRDKLRVVTTALFQQRDFTDISILDIFAVNLEPSLRGQLTESGLYMGTSLREFVHTFRHRTLILVKALILQKRIMFYGHPVERLCTYQYSLISLIPGLLQHLEDCGSPPLSNRAPTLSRPNSLKTSDHKSMMAFMGMPLDVFGKDAFFQPYLPLQQLDMLVGTPSWLCGSTNSIVTQQKEIDLFVDTETGMIEIRDPRLERSVALTAADRKWMDDIVNDVNANWDDEDPGRASSMQTRFKGSDDYLRTKFEEYISAALSSVKYRDFVAKGEGNGVLITGGTGGDVASMEDFNSLWISEFRGTNAYAVWDRITDPVIFDIIEPRHPCTDKPSVVSDLGLRLHEGIQDLKLDQQLAPAREAVARTFATGSTNFFKAVEGVKGRWRQPSAGSIHTTTSATASTDDSGLSTPIEVSKSDFEPQHDKGGRPDVVGSPQSGTLRSFSFFSSATSTPTPGASAVNGQSAAGSPAPAFQDHVRSASVTASTAASAAATNLTTWGAGIGSFFSSKLARTKSTDATATPTRQQQQQEKPLPPSAVDLKSSTSLPPLPSLVTQSPVTSTSASFRDSDSGTIFSATSPTTTVPITHKATIAGEARVVSMTTATTPLKESRRSVEKKANVVEDEVSDGAGETVYSGVAL
ncbi:hypothetical protein Agabi119p4_7510 [Agaricus bisporus var. burnettii]|uniref:UDENN domain-containing protein n=1 Tax=Agaricus bisporus var. burnettii TaxID=192524 RepID=A0A8H7C772_AGABI|nr:hypothetical protein Agabi119p4_7510 [Agaricus bisporus var. burnettii]